MISILDGNGKNIKESNYVHSSWSDTCKMSVLQSKCNSREVSYSSSLASHHSPLSQN